MPSQMKNYHDISMKWEEKYSDDLLDKYAILLLLLNDIKNLSLITINEAIADWNSKYGEEIKDLTYDYMQKIDKYVNKQILGNEGYFAQQEKINKLANTNYQLLNITTDYIKQQYTQLSILESKGNFSPDAINQILTTTVNQVQDKVTLYATMAITTSMNEFITTNATSEGWEEGLWRTQRDSKVRATHAAMDDRWIDLNDPNPQPAGFQPGCDYNCRCWYINFRKRDINGNWIYKFKI